MSRKRVVAWASGACVLLIAVIALSRPSERWREWWYGGPHEFTLCGLEFSASAVVLCVDRSGSSLPGFELARRVFPTLIENAPEHIEFGAVFFDSGILMHPADGKVAAATDASRRAMNAWLGGLSRGASSCLKEGLQSAIDMAKSGSGTRKIVIYIGDGGGTCRGSNEITYLQETLEQIAETAGEVALSVVGTRKTPLHATFLENLAAAAGGQYIHVDLPP